jgi:lipopolysaccharide transport system permease protein
MQNDPAETIYSADPALRSPFRFLAQAAEDLHGAPPVAWRLLRRNLQVNYRHSFLGYLWLLLPMVATTMLCLYLQSHRIVAVGDTGVPYPLYVLTGIAFWQLFVEALNAPLQRLKAEQLLITRSRVPHEALLLAGALEALLNCMVRILVVLPLLVVFKAFGGAAVLLLPVALIALLLLGTGLGLLLAPFGLLYDDVGRAMTLITTFWFFVTPVIYYPAPRGIISALNPVTPLLDTARAFLIGGGIDHYFAAAALIAVVVTLLAWVMLRLARPHLIARLG